MLNGISKILTGDMLKVISDMGHGDVLILADANFPGDTIAKYTTHGRLIRCPGVSVSDVYEAISDLFPLDVAYSEYPIAVMELTNEDKARKMPEPATWYDYEMILQRKYKNTHLHKIERFSFYEAAKKAYAVIQTGEERQYGNLLLVKGCVL
ncbi:MAG: fucose isomerase [Clostridia bacterium]|nr:fucose isomerase [Clostridia bacterium]